MTVLEDETGAPPPAGDADLVAEEHAVRREELAARLAEAQQKIAAANAPWWRGATPLTVAVVAGALTLLGNVGAALYTGYNSLEQEKTKAFAAIDAEKEKNKAALIIQAVSTSDQATARRNVLFFVESGFFKGQEEKIIQALDKYLPVLPSSSPSPRGGTCAGKHDGTPCGPSLTCTAGECVFAH
jgi:hypothetical protein